MNNINIFESIEGKWYNKEMNYTLIIHKTNLFGQFMTYRAINLKEDPYKDPSPLRLDKSDYTHEGSGNYMNVYSHFNMPDTNTLIIKPINDNETAKLTLGHDRIIYKRQ